MPHDPIHDTQLCPLAPNLALVFQHESPFEIPFTDPEGQHTTAAYEDIIPRRASIARVLSTVLERTSLH